jgi:DnaJ-class molecular chaperone
MLVIEKVLDVCPACYGRGKIEYLAADKKKVLVECAKCNGSGEVYVKKFFQR